MLLLIDSREKRMKFCSSVNKLVMSLKVLKVNVGKEEGGGTGKGKVGANCLGL